MKAGAGSGGGGSIPSEGGRRWPSRQLARDKKIALLLTERYEARGGRSGGVGRRSMRSSAGGFQYEQQMDGRVLKGTAMICAAGFGEEVLRI